MPLLGGLFGKRNTSRLAPSTATESVASSTSNRDSADGDYVLPDRPLPPPQPMYNMPAAGSSGKLKLPFRRKPPASRSDPKETPPSVVSLNDARPPHNISSVTSDPGHDLAPPPRKSSLFGAYNDSLPSLHSLPHDQSSSHVHSDTPSRPSFIGVRSETHSPPSSQCHAQKKSQGLLSWARERTKSKPPPPSLTAPSVPSTSAHTDDSSSFNLKSFRHVCADSPSALPETPPSASSSSNSFLAPPRPRPRGNSAASDSSQRISVAAFREAQARSRANSPVPSFRPPSTADTLRADARKRASTVSVVSGTDRLQPGKVAAGPMSRPRPGSSAMTSSSEDDSDSEDDEEVDSDGEPIPEKSGREQTITRPIDGPRARSDAGHGLVPTPFDQPSLNRRDPPKLSMSVPPQTLQSDQASFTRPRASVSTSALTPSGAARRASILAATTSTSSHANSKNKPRKPKDDSDESTDSSDADSEDMPLSGLIAPRRPGSSASNQSSSRPWMPAKPLIDIKTLAGGPPLLTPILRHEDSMKNLNAQRKEQDVEKDQPFSVPAALAHTSSTSPPISPSAGKQNATPVSKPDSAAHRLRPSTDVSATKGPENDDDFMNAIRLVGTLNQELDHPSEPQKPSTKSPSDRIVPTPIRAREPPTSFTVLSRPPQRRSTGETSVSLSPTRQAQSNTTPPLLSPPPETGVRQRTPAMPSAQSDKSDALSVSSATRSSLSRSSRIPPVPLIHSIPDSPSVKEDYKPGRPRSASRTSAANPSESHSRSSTTLVSAMSTSSKMLSNGFKPSSMPQRPFASNISTRGASPAGSSTGDSSSGRAPFTPRDGSDIGVRSKDDASDVGSTLKARGHVKKPSVTFEDSQYIRGRERAKTGLTDEQRTRERRRSEAKAAIELGKIVNGRGPLVHEDSDEDTGVRGRNPAINVTMEGGVSGMMVSSGWPAWQQPMLAGMPQVVPPQFSNDPAYLAAHQRALLVAKQAYQMAVAQHAMQVAGEEWERSSNIGFGSGGSVYGGGSGGSVYGGGSGNSAYGGGSGGSVYGGGGAGIAPMGMMGMPNMGMLMPHNQWGRSSVAFPSASASVYGGISSSQSEFGGTGGWGTRSVYGDSSSRGSSAQNGSASALGGSSRPRARTGVTAPPTSSSQQTRAQGKSAARSRAAAPPSSWKNVR